MGKEYTEIDAKVQAWIERQHMFFVATAPLAADGLVNCSPKGLDSLRVLGPNKLAYVDTGGSGIETLAHLRENSRIVIMMCAFDGRPNIFRFYGKGTAVEPHEADFAELLANFPQQPAARNVICIQVERIIDSCGYGVPLYDFRADRDSLANYFGEKSDEEIWEYRAKRNKQSLDGLPGLSIDRDD